MKKRQVMVKSVKHVSNDGRTIRVGFCEELGSWVLEGRSPHRKSMRIVFSTEAMQRIADSILSLSEIPSVQQVIEKAPRLTWRCVRR